MKPLLPFLAIGLVPTLLAAQTESPTPDSASAPSSTAVVLTPEQLLNITKQLEQIEQQINKNRGDALNTALTQFRSAMASDKSAIDLYQNCIKLVNFERKDLKGSDFQTWKDRNENQLKDPDFAAAIRLQLEYLVLSLQAQQTDNLAPLIPAVQAFLSKAVNTVQETTKHSASGAVQRGGGRLMEILNRSVSNSIFSQAYQLENHLNNKDWEYTPLNIGSIYSKIIFPSYLENKPQELPVQWDNRINGELALRKALQSETEFKVYYTEQYPRLQWAKAQFLFSKNINSLQSLADMLKIVRENPTHPNAGEWLQQLRQNVNASQPNDPSPSASAVESNLSNNQ